MEDYRYCPMCAQSLEWGLIEDRKRLTCKQCGWINYRNPLPVIGCLVLNDRGELLLIERGVEPCIGEWALPGGFIESDETLQEAGVRELKEETGLEGKPGRLIGVYTHESPLYGAILTCGVEFTVENENIVIGDDATDANFFPAGSLPEIPFMSHRNLVSDFLQL